MNAHAIAPLNSPLSRFTPMGRTPRLFWQLSAFLGLLLPYWTPAQGLLFTTDAGKITITGRTGTTETVKIPPSIGGLPVSAIAPGAFYGDALSNVEIPTSITTIGAFAFSNCIGLTSVKIPNSVTTIGSAAFGGCHSLINVTLPNSITTIERGTFNDCTSLINVTIPKSVITIGYAAFGLCQGLINVTIPDSVLSIGEGAFNSCYNLTRVTIPTSVTAIGPGAFSDCPRLTNAKIGTGVTAIGNQAFFNCSSLTDVTIPDSVITIGFEAFSRCSSLTSITIPDSVTTLRFSAFHSCSRLSSVTIGNGVTRIEAGSFDGCIGLINVTIGNGVTSIDDGTFSRCYSLKGIYFWGNAPNGIQSIFDGSSVRTNYYLSGNTGWRPSSGLRPTAVWSLPNPVILTTRPDFGPQANGFGFRISWATNVPVVLEATADLVQSVWSPVSTNTLTQGTAYLSDPHWTNYSARLYRVRSP